MLRSRIIGTGHYLPEKVLTNFDLEKMMDTSDEWIRQRTGIEERHIIAPGESASDMGTPAARQAMEKAGVSAEELDLIIFATLTADYYVPSAACVVQKNLNAMNAAAVDLNAACSGFVYALQTADALIRVGAHRTILIIAAEVISIRLDWSQRDSAVLFGDGAGAAVVRAEEGDHGVLSTFTKADGSDYEMLYIPAGGSALPVTPENINDVHFGLVFEGKGVFKQAVKAFEESIDEALTRSGVTSEEIDLFVPHQANARIISAVAERVGMPEEKIFMNIAKVANTSAASIPIALDQALDEGRIQNDMLILMAAFGGGLTWGSAVVRW